MAKTALISVSDKKGLIPFAKELIEKYDFKIVSSGGTANTLECAGLTVQKVEDYTGFPEMLEGRVKTLHPRIHGGILAKRDNELHLRNLQDNKIPLIDLVVVNLYPFQETVSKPDVTWGKAIENIDIGGPSMVRSAAKNHSDVVILSNPDQYNIYLKLLQKGEINNSFRKKLALEAFEHTAAYDIYISQWLAKQISSEESPFLSHLPLEKKLRYGENPHQSAAWFSEEKKGWGAAEQLQGKDLSANNLIDLESALATVLEFGYADKSTAQNYERAAVVVKHTNPCGVSLASSIEDAIKFAIEADSVSAFGGIVALNSSLSKAGANILKDLFLECIVAPEYEPEALNILSKKSNLRVLKISKQTIENYNKYQIKSIMGGVLIQELDHKNITYNDWENKTKAIPTHQEKKDLDFAWKIAKHVKSNAIVVASNCISLGIGAGQMNRVGSAKIALSAAAEKAKGAVLASDGFFPFNDTVKIASDYGISAIIQPGGSIRDKDSIDTCDKLGISMIFTGTRHFLH